MLRYSPVHRVSIAGLVAVALALCTACDPSDVPVLEPLPVDPSPADMVSTVRLPCEAAGEEGLVVRIYPPLEGSVRHDEGPPVVLRIPGGIDPGALPPPEWVATVGRFGMIVVAFTFPGGRAYGEEFSGGTYDFRGEDSILAAQDVLRYASGELHMTSTVPVSQMARLKKERPKELVMVPSMATYMYAFNVNRPPFDDVRVRRALTYAIDRNIIVSYITRGNQMPAFTLTPPYVSGFDFRQPEYATWSQTRRDEEAREALEEAGYNEDNPLEFELLYNTDESHKALAIVVSQMWKEKLGAKVTISNLEWKTFLSEKQAGNYGIARFGWKGDYNEASTFLTLLTSDSGNNDGGWSNETYDQLLLDARSSDDPNPYYVRAEEILWQAFPVVPVYFNTTVALVSPSLKGYPEKNPRNIVYSKDMYITAD